LNLEPINLTLLFAINTIFNSLQDSFRVSEYYSTNWQYSQSIELPTFIIILYYL